MNTVKVILIKEVRGLGGPGEIKTVKGGYARNFLLPRGLALLATPENLNRYEEMKRLREARAKRLAEAAQELAKRLSDLTVELSLLVGEEGKAFGSVKASDIAEWLAGAGIELEKGAIRLDNPIKTIGDHTVEVRLGPEITVPLKVRVVPKE
ncbi:MAG: 50S ribosomal protein L9 [candidate division WOR-3 bacterium]